MTKREYEMVRAKLVDERAELESSLARIRAKLDALDLVWNEVLGGEAAILKAAPPTLNAHDVVGNPDEAEASDGNYFTSKLVEMAVTDMNKPFSIIEIEAAILARHPHLTVNRTTISGKLKKMQVEGQLELVEAGQGRRPSSYKRIAHTTEV